MLADLSKLQLPWVDERLIIPAEINYVRIAKANYRQKLSWSGHFQHHANPKRKGKQFPAELKRHLVKYILCSQDDGVTFIHFPQLKYRLFWAVWLILETAAGMYSAQSSGNARWESNRRHIKYASGTRGEQRFRVIGTSKNSFAHCLLTAVIMTSNL